MTDPEPAEPAEWAQSAQSAVQSDPAASGGPAVPNDASVPDNVSSWSHTAVPGDRAVPSDRAVSGDTAVPGDPALPGDSAGLHWLAARLTLAAADLDTHANLLTNVLAAALPASVRGLERRRSMADRARRRPGRIVSLEVRDGDDVLRLARGADGWTAERRHVVHGVTLSTTPLSVAAWTAELARLLRARAERDEAVGRAVRGFLSVI